MVRTEGRWREPLHYRTAIMKARILIVEDDPHIAFGLEEILRMEGFEVMSCSQGDEAVAAVQKNQPALIILDIMLPGMTGYEICKELRQKGFDAPILMLTAKSQELDKVIGLELGADDYVTKPFGVRELTARVHALLRRGRAPAEIESSFTIGDAHIDPKRFQIRRGKQTEELTAKELKLLQLLYHAPGQVFSRDKLLNEVWGYNYFGTTRTLDQVIVQLRKKIGDRGHQPRHLLTVHGVGYKLLL
jgi:DNA-binding response OmpR family regulator